MSFREREVKGFVVDGDGSPVSGGKIEFKPTKTLGYTNTHIVIDRAFQAVTEENGSFSITLWCDEDSLVAINYTVKFPIANNSNPSDKNLATISLSYEDGSAKNIGTLIAESTDAEDIISSDSLAAIIDSRSIAPNDYALYADGDLSPLSQGQNINLGYFFPRNDIDNDHPFVFEWWATPIDRCWYVGSAGYGGSHEILAGFNGANSNLFVTGNVWDTKAHALVSIGSVDSVPAGTLHHVLFGWDGSFLYVFIDGVISGKVPFTGNRGSLNSAAEGVFYLLGSDHSYFRGWFYRARLFEDVIPFTGGFPSGYFVPEQYFRTSFAHSDDDSVVPAVGCWDATTPQNIIEDHGIGYKGAKHAGVRSWGKDVGAYHEGLQRGKPNEQYLPQFVKKPFQQSSYLGVAPGSPAGKILYHDFNEPDRVPAWENPAAIGLTAPTGQTWSASLGILSGKLVSLENSAQNAWINAGTPNLDITFTNGNIAKKFSYTFRGSNNKSEYLEVGTGINQGLYDVNLTKFGGSGAGNIATATGALTNENFTTLRIVANGANITVYVDNVLKLTATTSYLTGTYVGCGFNPLNRLDKIEAIAL